MSKAVSFTELLGVSGSQALEWTPFPHQVPPEGDWRIWLLKGGRGSGKTEAGARECLRHLREYGAAARVGVGAPTIADARAVCAEGPTGLITIAKDEFQYNRSLLEARHKDGGYVRFLGAEIPGRWNGPQWSLLWADELALWPEESWNQALFGLRLGANPRAIVTTTPKARRFVRALYDDPRVAVTHATTFDNPSLPADMVEYLRLKFEGTRLGRQELMGEDVEDVEGAIFKREWIEAKRIATPPEDLTRFVVAIDPAGTHRSTSDETAMCVAAIDLQGEYYVLFCSGYRLPPGEWARTAIALYEQYAAAHIIAETNMGGDLVVHTITTENPNVPVRRIHASHGKVLRAEPVALLYERGLVHHVGVLGELEDQMCCFPVGSGHDDQVDAAVYALLDLQESNPTNRSESIIGIPGRSMWGPRTSWRF